MKEKKQIRNIAIIINSLAIGGAEKTAAMLSIYLSNHGYKVFLMLDNYDRGLSYAHCGQVVRMLNMKTENPWLDLYYKAKDLKRKKELCEIDCSISFIEDNNFVNILSRTGERMIVSVRTFLSGRMEEWKKDARRYHMLIPLLYNRADKVVVQTQIGKKDLCSKFGVKENKTVVIPNSTDTKGTGEKEVSFTEKNSVVMVGRLDEVKAHWYAVMAMKKVVDIDKSIHLYILGSGKLAGSLRTLAQEYQIEENIHFMGFQKNVELYLRQAKMYVMTSKAEGFPNSMLDALVAGLPVISTDCISGPRDILAPGTPADKCTSKIEYAEYGILIPCLKVPDFEKTGVLAEAILKLSQDEQMREHYAAKARERAGDYNQEIIFRQWENTILGNEDV